MPINQQLAERLRLCTSLPTPPSTAIRIINLANDASSNMTQIADCVALDPAMAAKMLKVANSPLYNARRGVTNVRQAVNLMGTHTAISVALSFSIVRSLKGTSAVKETRFWQRAVLAALACRLLAKRCNLNADESLLAGLLQDVGILALQSAMPGEYAAVEAGAGDHEALLEAERIKFGSGHDEVGYWLLKRWNLPDYLAVACLTSHSAPSPLGTLPSIGSCVAVSGYLADIFLNPGIAMCILKANHAAQHRLGLSSDDVASLITEMSVGAKDLEEFFDLPLIDDAQVEALVAEAKELIFIANLGQHHDLEQKSQRDALTGAHNRTYLDEALSQEFSVAARHGWPLSVAFVDIDHFKQVNDVFGHAVGDNALVTLSRLISAQIRSGDVLARYGGEEFVLLFPGTPVELAFKVLTRIKDSIASFQHPLSAEETFSLTVSAGLACHMNTSSAYATPEEVLRAADKALYAAKRAGRNQIAVAGADSSTS